MLRDRLPSGTGAAAVQAGAPSAHDLLIGRVAMVDLRLQFDWSTHDASPLIDVRMTGNLGYFTAV